MIDPDELAANQEREAEYMRQQEARRETRTVEEILAAGEIQPALTPEEWADALARKRPDLYRADEGTPEAYHAAAALHLHGQPFGFTWAMHDSIVDLAETMRREATRVGPMHAWWDTIDRATHAAARIAALLPPRG